MTTCRRRICTADADGAPFCSDRCERLHTPRTRGHDEAADLREAHNRARIIHNDRSQR